MLVPIAVDARPEKPMKYPNAAVRNRSFNRIRGAAMSSMGRTDEKEPGSISMPKLRKKIATNASRRDSIFTFSQPARCVYAKAHRIKNARTRGGVQTDI